MTVSELLQLTLQYGLPLIMFFGVLYLSARGVIIWPPTIKVYEDRLADAIRQRDRFADIAHPAVRAMEQGAEALKLREGQ